MGNEYHTISDELEVERVDGKPTSLPETKHTITINLYGFIKEVKKEWLYWLSYFKLRMPKGYEERVFDLEFKDYFSLKHMKIDPKFVVFKKPVYLKENNNYRLIARFPNYSISTSGIIYNMHTRTHNKPRQSTRNGKPDYKISTTVDQAGLFKSNEKTTHRLVAITWIENDDFTKKYLVDHIDGDKTNCHKDNLRWVSHQENNKLICEQGLRSDNISIKVRDIDTGKVNHFHSITQACSFMQRSVIDTRTSPIKPGRIWRTKKGRFEIKYANDNSPWHYENNDDIKNVNQKVFIEVFDKEGVLLFKANNLPELLKKGFDGKRSADTIHKAVKLYAKNNPEHNIKLTLLDNYNDKEKSYVAKNIKTGEIFRTNSRKDLEKKAGTNKSSVQKSIANNGAYVYNDWAFKLDNQYPFEKPLNASTVNKALATIVKDVKENTKVAFNSLRKASKYLHVDKKTLKYFLDKDRLLYNKFLIATESI